MHLLFVTTDHQRADSIGAVQCGREVTPRLNALAAEGTQFTRAYSACPLCVPARAALATGLQPARTGVQWNDWNGSTARACTTLHERLAAAGFALGHAGMDHVRLRPRLRERVDFAGWTDEDDHARYLRERGHDLAALEASGPFRAQVRERLDGVDVFKEYSTAHAAAWPFPREDFRDEFFARVAERSLEQLAGGARPFALFVNFWAPHPPLYVPPELADAFSPADIELPANVGLPAAGEPANRRDGIAAQLAANVDEAGWRRAWSAHLALTHLVDGLIGRLIDALQRAGVADDTLVVVTSDHGEHLGQHAMYQKMELYEPAMRVPLVVRFPGGAAGTRCAVPVSHLDLVPTVLDLLGLPAAEEADGRSLGAVVRIGEVPVTVPVYSQYTGNNGPSVNRHAVVLGRHKLIADANGPAELYDLESDPLEMHNRAGNPAFAKIEAELRALSKS